MPNWVINKVKVEGKDAESILKSHMTKDEYGQDQFDFNTIDKMPEDLKVEKSSRSADGLKLYIAKINPLMLEVGKHEDKMLPIQNWFNKMIELFGRDCIDRVDKYILKPKEVSGLKEKYGQDFDKVMDLGEMVFHNIENYGVPDWYDWSIEHWGTKWNTCNTNVREDKNEVYFDTAWSPSVEAVEKFSKMHPELKVTHEYAEEQTGFMSGRFEYEDGEKVSETQFEPFSKEAYEMSFELWGNEDEYKFNKETNTYEYVDPDEEKEME